MELTFPHLNTLWPHVVARSCGTPSLGGDIILDLRFNPQMTRHIGKDTHQVARMDTNMTRDDGKLSHSYLASQRENLPDGWLHDDILACTTRNN